jgi:hypothetical protein
VSDPWEVLGLDPGTPPGEVRARWLALSRELHPDHHHDAGAARRLAVVNAAYAALRVERGRGEPAAPTATFTVSDARPAVFESLLMAAADIGDLTDADEPATLDLRLWGGWCHVELAEAAGKTVVNVEGDRIDPELACEALIAALVRYGRYGEGGG